MPITLTSREKRTSPAPRQMPQAMTKKLKKISVAAAINSVCAPRTATSGSLVNKRMMGPDQMATGIHTITMTADPMRQMERAKRSARSFLPAPRDWPIRAVAV